MFRLRCVDPRGNKANAQKKRIWTSWHPRAHSQYIYKSIVYDCTIILTHSLYTHTYTHSYTNTHMQREPIMFRPMWKVKIPSQRDLSIFLSNNKSVFFFFFFFWRIPSNSPRGSTYYRLLSKNVRAHPWTLFYVNAMPHMLKINLSELQRFIVCKYFFIAFIWMRYFAYLWFHKRSSLIFLPNTLL